ncbi:MAG: polyphosphate kinase 1 [Spirochaetales bacterium]|nr:polyphosphate kinase 1 [Spirochaetales bacterium]
MEKSKFIPKEISWLSFNARVLQEAENRDVPIIQRIRFLGIFNSNLEEYFRIRVATLYQLSSLKKKAKQIIGYDPKRVLKTIKSTVLEQSKIFEKIYNEIIGELAARKIFIINENQLNDRQKEYVNNYFNRKVHNRLIPFMLNSIRCRPVLKDKSIYLVVKMERTDSGKKPKYSLIEIPTAYLSRFLILPSTDGKKYIIFLDDVIRFSLNSVFSMFGFNRYSAYSIKLTRDCEIDVDQDFSESMIKKISKSLRKRKKGAAVRFMYDAQMPEDMLDFIITKLKMTTRETFMPGGRYHNLMDLRDFPNIGPDDWEYEKLPPIPHRDLAGRMRILSVIRKKDIMLYYPYNSFDVFIDMLREAAMDPKVDSIKITIYRAAKRSSVLNALINAVKNGKRVTVIVELQARFDEEANINWANKLREEGVFVHYGVPGLKVHSKLCLITRREKNTLAHYAAVATGNFNEDTAKIYCDHCLLTSNPKITTEVYRLFDYLESMYKLKKFNNLIVSPFDMRETLVRLIDNEISRALKKEKAAITIKLNNLVDPQIIKKLYEASSAGVPVRIIARAMFSLKPGEEGMSENIQAISIVDRFLEHSRIFVFHNGGEELYFISSADFMQRNLDKRVEVICPIYDKQLQSELQTLLDLQWHDNVKSRNLKSSQLNEYIRDNGKQELRSQYAMYQYLLELNTKKETEETSRNRKKPEK